MKFAKRQIVVGFALVGMVIGLILYYQRQNQSNTMPGVTEWSDVLMPGQKFLLGLGGMVGIAFLLCIVPELVRRYREDIASTRASNVGNTPNPTGAVLPVPKKPTWGKAALTWVVILAIIGGFIYWYNRPTDRHDITPPNPPREQVANDLSPHLLRQEVVVTREAWTWVPVKPGPCRIIEDEDIWVKFPNRPEYRDGPKIDNKIPTVGAVDQVGFRAIGPDAHVVVLQEKD